MPRYVVLLHEVPAGYPRGTHYDLMLESAGVLRTWACEENLAPGKTIRAQRLADHRLEYLDQEGPVSGGRGHVTRVESGQYEELNAGPNQALQVRLRGEKLRGVLTLTPDSREPTRCQLSLVAEPSE